MYIILLLLSGKSDSVLTCPLGMRAIKNIGAKIADEIDKYAKNLKELEQSLANTSVIESRVIINRLADDMVEQGETINNIGMRKFQGY